MKKPPKERQKGPVSGGRRRLAGQCDCTVCERRVEFCWACPCGFRLCAACMEENAWGMTCNNITWECPDCGAARSY